MLKIAQIDMTHFACTTVLLSCLFLSSLSWSWVVLNVNKIRHVLVLSVYAMYHDRNKLVRMQNVSKQWISLQFQWICHAVLNIHGTCDIRTLLCLFFYYWHISAVDISDGIIAFTTGFTVWKYNRHLLQLKNSCTVYVQTDFVIILWIFFFYLF